MVFGLKHKEHLRNSKLFHFTASIPGCVAQDIDNKKRTKTNIPDLINK
jgi:hypothetical protein